MCSVFYLSYFHSSCLSFFAFQSPLQFFIPLYILFKLIFFISLLFLLLFHLPSLSMIPSFLYLAFYLSISSGFWKYCDFSLLSSGFVRWGGVCLDFWFLLDWSKQQLHLTAFQINWRFTFKTIPDQTNDKSERRFTENFSRVFLNPMLQLQCTNATAFCMQFKNSEDR